MRILVIKLSAFGDFIFALGMMKSIRKHYPDAEITLMTTKPFKAFGEKTGYFDRIIIDERPKFWQFGKIAAMLAHFRNDCYDLVYDLQMNDRTKLYSRFIRTKAWAGNVSGREFYYDNPNYKKIHPEEKLGALLRMTGITEIYPPDIGIFKSDIMTVEPVPADYVLMLPGAAPTRPRKLWDGSNYGKVAKVLATKGLATVAVGTENERRQIEKMRNICPEVLWFKTSFDDIAELARHARFIIGNDTGPMIVAGLSDRPCLVLYSDDSSPESSRPLGKGVIWLRKDNINDITVDEVLEQWNK